MKITHEEFVTKTGAKKVAGQYILGVIGKRFVAATRKEGVFSLTPEGEEYLATLGAPEPQVSVVEEKPKRTRKKKEVVEELSVDDELASLLAEDE